MGQATLPACSRLLSALRLEAVDGWKAKLARMREMAVEMAQLTSTDESENPSFFAKSPGRRGILLARHPNARRPAGRLAVSDRQGPTVYANQRGRACVED